MESVASLREERGEDVVAEGLAVGRDDVVGGEGGVGRAVAVGLADFEGVHFEDGGDFLDDVFDGGDALGAAEAAEGGVGGEVGFADAAGDADVGKVVGVVDVEQGALEDGEGEVEGAAAVGEELDVDGVDDAGAVECHFVVGFKWVAFSGDVHVIVFGVDEAGGAAGDLRRRRRPWRRGWRPGFPCRRIRRPCVCRSRRRD